MFYIFFAYLFTSVAFGSAYAEGFDGVQGTQATRPKREDSQPVVQEDTRDDSTKNADYTVKLVEEALPKNSDVKFEYKIGTNDVLEIEVFQVEDLKHTSRVNGRGYISVPLLGSVRVAGMTVDEAERFIREAYAKDLLQNPHVSIFVKEYESQKYTVEGEVKEPGVFPLKGPTTLLQAIAMAKGVESLADYEGIVIFRINHNRQVIGYIADLEKIRDGEMEDPLIATNDIIVVPSSNDKAWIDRITSTLRGFLHFGFSQ